MNAVVRVLASEEAELDLPKLLELLNGLQFFFRVECGAARVPSPPDRDDGMPCSADDIREFLASSAVLAPRYPLAHHVLLTDRPVSPVSDLDHFVAPDLTVISNHFETRAGDALTIAAARRVLHAGMLRLMDKACADPGCVCSSQPVFLYFCDACQQRLRTAGYRDAIRHLKETINWLNEQTFGRAEPIAWPHARSVGPTALPLASLLAERIAQAGGPPFRGKMLLMVLHFLSDLLPFVQALRTVGAAYEDMVLVAKPYPYPRRDEIAHRLRTMGVNVHRASEQQSVERSAEEVLRQLMRDESRRQQRLLVIEDGGYFAPLLHRPEFTGLLARCDGVVEQTAKGAREDERQIPKPGVPILSVARSKFKGAYESPEIGRITVLNISRFVGDLRLSGAHAIVFGFGSVGEHVAYNLNHIFNMGVSVVESKNELRLMAAQQRKDIVVEAKRSFADLRFREDAMLVVGTTGEQSINCETIEGLGKRTILASTSSDQIEIDVDGLRTMAAGRVREVEQGVSEFTLGSGNDEKQVVLLADGYPINFYGSESLPNQTIDPILTLLMLSAVEISCGAIHECKIDEVAVDGIVAKYEIVASVLR